MGTLGDSTLNAAQRKAFAVLIVAAVAGTIGSEFPEQMFLQHIPTVFIIIVLPLAARRVPFTTAGFFCIVSFMLLHVVGARYIYSYVPYDEWSGRIFGVTISERFGFERNHFDRAVHFAFGALAVRPAWEVLTRVFRVPPRFALYATVEFVLAFSLLYELFEWGLTLVLSPADAGAYNGEQGDIWDAHRDMALALVGSIVGLVWWRAATSAQPSPSPN